jgi:poly-gamma-glutamate capsule biosynthesis protein CapA/YwtB (metallophosphatase superfamily)
MKILSWFLIIIGFAGLAGVMFFGFDSIGAEYAKIAEQASTSTNNVVTQYIKDKISKPKEYTVVLVGDMMLDRGVKSKVYEFGEGNYDFVFENIHHVLAEADVTFGNLEGSLSDVGADTGKPYSFRFETQTANALQAAGFDVLALANNHMLDWGRNSLCETVKNLEAVGIFGSGAGCNSERAEKAYMHELGDGTKLGFLSFTEFYKGGYARDDAAGLARFSEENMTKRITELKEQGTDIVFVSLHWGTEYHTRSNEAQQNLARTLVDAGADVIIGHHPHVAQEIEKYKDSWIIYSLGNFIFDQKFSEQTMKGLLANIVIRDGEVANIEPIVVYLNKNYQPTVDPDGEYEYLAGTELTEAHEEYHRMGAPR